MKRRYLGFVLLLIIGVAGISVLPDYLPQFGRERDRSNHPMEHWNTNLTYAERRDLHLAHANGTGSYYGQSINLFLNNPTINEDTIRNQLDRIDARQDTYDFVLCGLMRMVYLNQEKQLFSPELVEDIKNTLINTKYWFKDPGDDSAIFWTENHIILFHSSELLAGQLFPNETFSLSNMTGQDHVDRVLPSLDRFLSLRGKLGFVEWHSPIYTPYLAAALLNLVDFAENQEIATKAAMLLDLIIFGLATQYFHAEYATAHSRVSEVNLIGWNETARSRYPHTSSMAWLHLGLGAYNRWTVAGLSMAAFLTSSYERPEILEGIAKDARDGIEHRERNGIEVDEGLEYGVNYEDMDDLMYWWSLAAVVAPPIFEKTLELVETYDLDTNLVFGPPELIDLFKVMSRVRGMSLEQYSRLLKEITLGLPMGPANVYTYRTPYYQLSGAQDYKKGLNSFQDHPWQATLSTDAYIFTNSPSGLSKDQDDWVGGWMPRATLYKNVGIIQYDREVMPFEAELAFWGLGAADTPNRETYQHAYFPQWAFDEVHEADSWTFGRVNDSYVALYSYQPTEWREDYELFVNSKKNVWITELSSAQESGSFENFIDEILTAPLHVVPRSLGYEIMYISPSQGVMQVDWTSDLQVQNNPIDIGPYDRYENPYTHTPFGEEIITIEFDDAQLILDFESGTRTII